jgi:hypothetical protein
MKKYLLILIVFISINSFAQQESGVQQFWNKLKSHCGYSYEGVVNDLPENDAFSEKKLVVHFRACSDSVIRIPFFVGDDKSRTFVLTLKNDRIQLKHDHRHADGTSDEVTMYGGTSSNSGLPNIQFFPADQETADLISYASTNVWWMTVDEKTFTYNLRRMGTDRLFTVTFDITKPVATPSAPWGWVD